MLFLCFVLFQSSGTEKSSQHFLKEADDISRDGNVQTLRPQFTIFQDQLQPSAAKWSTADQSTAIIDYEEMELNPSVTAAFVPETFPVQNEIFDEINNTG